MEKTAMMLLIDMLDGHISKHKDHANKFDTGAMVAKNFAMSLLDKEKRNIEDAFDDGTIDGVMIGSSYYIRKYKKNGADASHQINDKKVAGKNDWKDFYDEDYMNRIGEQFGNWWEKI